MTSREIFNPYPGLRPFRPNEAEFFFGRDKQADGIIEKLERNRFAAIVGPAGSGKTSLINAGVIPLIQREARKWKIIITRPGISPIDNFSKVLAQNTGGEGNANPDGIAESIKNNPEGSGELIYRLLGGKNENILIIADQLEDLFIPGIKKDTEEVEKYITILGNLSIDGNLPLHSMIAVRQENLDEIMRIRAMARVIYGSNFVLSEIAGNDLSKVINGPASLYGIRIDQELENRLLDGTNGIRDMLPALQHVLNRMWDYWLEHANLDQPLSIKEYDAARGIENAVSVHADQVYLELSQRDQRICEKMFKTLTCAGPGNKEIAVPSRIEDIAYITSSTVADITSIVEAFSREGGAFLQIQEGEEPGPGAVVDLCHDSLMRLWKRLAVWIEEEAASVSMYRKLTEASRLYQMGKSELLDKQGLIDALEWNERNSPTLQWARRHNPAFERTMQYLNKSYEEYELKEYFRLRKSRRNSILFRILLGLVVLFVIVLGGVIVYTSGFIPIPGERQGTAIESEADNREPELSATLPPGPGGAGIPDQVGQASATGESVTGGSSGSPDNSEPEEHFADTVFPGDETGVIETSPLPEEETFEEYTFEDTFEEMPFEEEGGLDIEQAAPGLAEYTMSGEPVLSRDEASVVSRSLAINSLQVDNDPDLKALLAFQSHMFNNESGGPGYRPEIFGGLITSVLDLYGPGFNAISGHNESVNSIIFMPNSNIFFTASSDGTITQWDAGADDGRPATLIRNNVVNNTLAISPNGQWLAVGTDGMGIQVLNITGAGTNPSRINLGGSRVILVEFHPDGENLLFAGSDNSIIRYNILNGRNEVIGRPSSEPLAMAVSPDGELVAVGTREGRVLLYFLDGSGGPVEIYSEAGSDILALSFSRSGSRIAAGNIRGEIKLMEIQTGNLLATLSGHSARITDIGFGSNDRIIASSSFDGTIRIWTAGNFDSAPVVLNQEGSWVRAVAFNTSGNRLVTGSRLETRLRVWVTDPDELASMICDRVTRNMTRAEWERYVGETIPYRESCPRLTNRLFR